MKTTKIIIFTCAIAVLSSFAGCAEKPAQQEVTTQPQAQQEAPADLSERLSPEIGDTPANPELPLDDNPPELPPTPEEIRSNDVLAAEIIPSENYQRCTELTIERYVQECEVNILANLALAADDSSICDNASTQSAKDSCSLAFSMGQEGSPAPGSI